MIMFFGLFYFLVEVVRDKSIQLMSWVAICSVVSLSQWLVLNVNVVSGVVFNPNDKYKTKHKQSKRNVVMHGNSLQ